MVSAGLARTPISPRPKNVRLWCVIGMHIVGDSSAKLADRIAVPRRVARRNILPTVCAGEVES